MLNLKKFLTIGVTLASICVANATSLFGDCCCVEPSTDLSLSAGWRRDEIKGSTKHENNHSGRQHFNAKDLNTWEIGVQLHAQMPEWCDCGCDGSNWWLRQFYVRGYAYRGWVTDGKFHTHANSDVSGISTDHAHAKIRNGRTVDGTIGVGFLYPVCDGFGIGPVGGYAYDQIHVKPKHRHHHDESNSSSSSDATIGSSGSSGSSENDSFRFTQTWRGGWVGVDGVYYWCYCDNQFQFDFGYEYHWPQLRATVHGHQEGEHSNHSNDAWGQVFYIDGHYNVCDCWDIILGFDYKDFKTKKSKKHDNKWWSYGVTLDLAYRF